MLPALPRRLVPPRRRLVPLQVPGSRVAVVGWHALFA